MEIMWTIQLVSLRPLLDSSRLIIEIEHDDVSSSLEMKKKRKNRSGKARRGIIFYRCQLKRPLPPSLIALSNARCSSNKENVRYMYTRYPASVLRIWYFGLDIRRAACAYSLEMDGRFGKLIDRFDARLETDTTRMTQGSSFVAQSRVSGFQVSNTEVENSDGTSFHGNFSIISYFIKRINSQFVVQHWDYSTKNNSTKNLLYRICPITITIVWLSLETFQILFSRDEISKRKN